MRASSVLPDTVDNEQRALAPHERGMNRHQRRAEAAQPRRATTHDKAAAVAHAMHYLAHTAAGTATGATLFHSDGTKSYIDADDARALYGSAKPRGRA